MRRRNLIIGLGAAAALAVGCLPVLLAARNEPIASLPPERISPAEHQQAIEALKPPKRQRPAIAILALTEGTEISDLLNAYGVLAESGVADVTVVADRPDPIRLCFSHRCSRRPKSSRTQSSSGTGTSTRPPG